jgi:type I restriction enzyme, S subunit
MEVKPGYKQTEVGVIPEDWEVKTLGAVADYTNGKAHEQNITDSGRFVVVNSKFISSEGVTRKYSDQCLCPTSKGDVLMVMSDVPNGRAIAKCYMVESDETYTVNQRICILRPHSINAKLLFYKLDRNRFYLAFDDGAQQTNLRKDDVLSCPLGFPKSEDEQRTIADALGDAGALLGELDQLIAKKRDLKQAAMQQLLTGQTRLPGFHGEWEVKTLGSFVEIRKGELITEANAVVGSIPVIAGGKKPAYFHNRANRFGKTVTISGSGASAGYVSLYWSPIFASDCSTISEGEGYSIEFVYFLLQSRQDEIYRAQTGGAQPHIHPNDLRPMSVRVPHVDEQVAIAEVLTDMDAELAAFEQRREKARALKQAMMQELLTGKTRLV